MQQLEFFSLFIVAAPGILLITGGGVQNSKQAAFRIALFVIGLTSYIGIKIYQRNQAKRGK